MYVVAKRPVVQSSCSICIENLLPVNEDS